MNQPGLVIGGESVPGATTFDVTDPRTGEVFASAPACSPEQLDAAFAAADAAFAAWSADEEHRRSLLAKLGSVIEAAGHELVELMLPETGKRPGLAAIEITAAKLWFDYYASVDLPRELIADDAAARIETVRRPLGVVAGIAPWNFPIASAITKIAPALRAGNTIVLKPSPFTPFAALRLGELLNEVLPAGVVNIVTGDDELGAAMTSHPTPRKITFTGSIKAGKHVAVSAGEDLKRVTLELGGNDAAILLDDIDVGATAHAVLARAFFNAGQACALPKRIFAPASIYDAVVDAFAEAASALDLGGDDDDGMGPLSTRPQYERVCRLVDAALADGLDAVVGGHAADRPGFYFEPTILAAAREGVRIVDEEQFGPALPILRYTDVEEAVARANDTRFGLCGSVWSEDSERAAAVAEQLECGVTYVNAHGVHRPSMPLLGVKWSGIGVENGVEGLLEFTRPQVVYRATDLTDAALK